MKIVDAVLSVYTGFRVGWAFVVAILCFALYMVYSIKERKKLELPITGKAYLKGIIFSAYMVALLGGTMLNRTIGIDDRIELVPFWSYWETFVNRDDTLWQQMLFNIAVFVPWGFLFPILFEKMKDFRWNVIGATGVSLVIEVIQFLFKIGLFEFDDIFHNTLGALIGYAIWKAICKRSMVEKRDK